MANWITASGVVTNVTTMFDLGYLCAPSDTIQGKGAGVLLKEVDDILKNTSVLLENHKEILTAEEYEKLKAQYRTYHWRMTDEGQQHRAVKDEIIRQSRILSQLYANKESRQDRAKDLLTTVEEYQTKVLAASRKATIQGVPSFPDEEVQRARHSESTCDQSSNRSITSWFSAFGGALGSTGVQADNESMKGTTSFSTSTTTAVHNIADSAAHDHGFIVAVTHISQDKSLTIEASTGVNKSSAPDTHIYRRTISFENAGRRIDIIDPRFHDLKDDELQIDESSLLAMSELGRRLMNERDAETTSIEGCQTAAGSIKPAAEAISESLRGMGIDETE